MKNLVIVLLATLIGCVNISGGDGEDNSSGKSGVVGRRKTVDLTPAEKQDFCGWIGKEMEKATGVYACEDSEGSWEITVEAVSVAECEVSLAKNSGCPISKLEACFTTFFNNPCNELFSPECAFLETCANDPGDGNGGGNNGGGYNEYCYEHTYNGDTTGKQCFATRSAYCESLCAESNPLSANACEREC